METTNHALSAFLSLLGRHAEVEETRFRHTKAIESFLARVCGSSEPTTGRLSKLSRLGERVVCKIVRARRF